MIDTYLVLAANSQQDLINHCSCLLLQFFTSSFEFYGKETPDNHMACTQLISHLLNITSFAAINQFGIRQGPRAPTPASESIFGSCHLRVNRKTKVSLSPKKLQKNWTKWTVQNQHHTWIVELELDMIQRRKGEMSLSHLWHTYTQKKYSLILQYIKGTISLAISADRCFSIVACSWKVDSDETYVRVSWFHRRHQQTKQNGAGITFKSGKNTRLFALISQM